MFNETDKQYNYNTIPNQESPNLLSYFRSLDTMEYYKCQNCMLRKQAHHQEMTPGNEVNNSASALNWFKFIPANQVVIVMDLILLIVLVAEALGR